MSTDDSCAACGKSGDGLKTCTACKMVKYCSVQCQKAHRPRHKKDCRKRAAELLDEKLFQDPPPPEDCPVCFLPLPTDNSQILYQTCCGKMLCYGCVYAVQINIKALPPCPFCREKPTAPGHLNEHMQRIRKRMEANDPEAFVTLGCHCRDGLRGLVPQDYKKAFELWSKGAELGSVNAYPHLGDAYRLGWGIEVDAKKSLHYYQLAAMAGDVVARYNLGASEDNAGNVRRALKHWMIAAGGGCDKSLQRLKCGYREGNITKDDFAKALRAYQKSVTDVKSDDRDRAAKIMSMP